MPSPLQNIVIVGGGTAGWMAAAAITNYTTKINRCAVCITVIDSSDIPSVGVGEATIPNFVDFNRSIGIDEIELIKATQATFKLGIAFENWHSSHPRFFHPFADYGLNIDGVEFHQYLNYYRNNGHQVNLWDYCFSSVLAQKHNFAQPHSGQGNPLANYSYAYHFDAALYAKFLKAWCLRREVSCIDAKVDSVELRPDNGFIKSLVLNDGHRIEGDFFIDCSGFKGILIEQALQTGYEDWSRYLFCDSALALQTTSVKEPAPYTRAIAKESGWQWEIPLQHRTGNGYIYASQYQSDDSAKIVLLNGIVGEPLGEIKKLSFTPGRRKKIWHKNCFALGLASGFLEPLESTSISLIQTALAKLLTFFPSREMESADQAEVNRLHNQEVERIRDFLILHYTLSDRTDSQFWRDYRNLHLPTELRHKLDVFQNCGHIVMLDGESFEKSSWLTLYEAFGVKPVKTDPRAERVYLTHIEQKLAQISQSVEQAADQAISHQAFIDRHCRAPEYN